MVVVARVEGHGGATGMQTRQEAAETWPSMRDRLEVGRHVAAAAPSRSSGLHVVEARHREMEGWMGATEGSSPATEQRRSREKGQEHRARRKTEMARSSDLQVVAFADDTRGGTTPWLGWCEAWKQRNGAREGPAVSETGERRRAAEGIPGHAGSVALLSLLGTKKEVKWVMGSGMMRVWRRAREREGEMGRGARG